MKKWLVNGEIVEAAWYSEGTDFVQFWIADEQVAAIRTGTPFEEVVDGETELLAEVGAEGQADDKTFAWASNADAELGEPPGKVSQRPGKVPRVRRLEVHARDSGYVGEQPDSETPPSV